MRLDEVTSSTYRQDVFKMQQDLIDQGWDDVQVGKSNANPSNMTLIVSKAGYNSVTLTALASFVTLWSSRIHTATSASNMLDTMQRKLHDLNLDLSEEAEPTTLSSLIREGRKILQADPTGKHEACLSLTTAQALTGLSERELLKVLKQVRASVLSNFAARRAKDWLQRSADALR